MDNAVHRENMRMRYYSDILQAGQRLANNILLLLQAVESGND